MIAGGFCWSAGGADCALGSCVWTTCVAVGGLGAGAWLAWVAVFEAAGAFDQPPLNRFQPSCGAAFDCCAGVELCGAFAGAAWANTAPDAVKSTIREPTAILRREGLEFVLMSCSLHSHLGYMQIRVHFTRIKNN